MSEEYPRIEVITGAARRRRWTTEEKLRIVDETLRSGESISVLARRHGVAPNLLYRWRRLMTEGGAVAVQADDAVTLKRDYLRVSPVPDARTALDQIAGWFDDYNENHPHSGLRMRSPREFRRAHQPAEVSG